jgi:putative membrane protein
MWNEVGNMHWSWIGFGAFHMLLFWGFLILGIVVLVRVLSGSDTPKSPDAEDALEVLKLRFARGEIDEEEFLERKKHLQQ